MSKYTDTIDDCDRECPYCGYTYQPEPAEYSDNLREEECENCDKSYYVHDSFYVTHHATPDCELNGQEHDYQSITLGNGQTHGFCTVCDKCRPAKALENE